MRKTAAPYEVVVRAGFIFCLFSFILCSLSGIFDFVLAKEPFPLLVIERDVPRVIDRMVVVNHRAFVVNLSETSLEVNLRLVIPKALYKESEALFGEEVQLDLPMYYPQQVEVKKYHDLERPIIGKRETEVIYTWNGVSLPPHEAAVVQLENYLGPVSMFYTPQGFDFSGLVVKTDYRCSSHRNNAHLSLHYDLQNVSRYKFEFLQLEVFFPDTIMMAGESGEDIQLFEVVQYCLSSNAHINKWIMDDGFRNQARGNSVLSRRRIFASGDHHRFFVTFSGKRKSKIGEIYPLLVLNCRMQGIKLLEPLIVQSKKNISVGHFCYTEYVTSVPDSKLFKFDEEEIRVVFAEEVTKPTFATVVPEPEEPLSDLFPPPSEMERESKPAPGIPSN